MENARKRLEEEITQALSERNLLGRLRRRLFLERYPNRIECFDNSNLQGTNPVAGMVVFEKGKPNKSAYRKYKLRSVTTPDDYTSMAEVLTRRFNDVEKSGSLPDLLMVDGGKGQLNVALDVIEALGLSDKMNVLAIAKKDSRKGEVRDKIFLPKRANPVNFGKDGDLLLFLQNIRDESHRFAISFYRKRHRGNMIHSKLEEIRGVGEKRRGTLLRHFKSIDSIRTADVSEIAVLPGFNRKLAESVLETLRNG